MEAAMLKTLKGKFSLIYIGLVALIAAVGCVSEVTFLSLQRSVDGLMTNNYKSISAVQHMKDALAGQNGAVLTYISINNASGIGQFYSSGSSFSNYFGIEANNITEEGEQSIVDTVKTDYSSYGKDFSQLQDILHTQGQTAAINFYNNIMLPEYSKITQELDSDIDLNQESMFSSKNKASRNAGISVYALLLFSFVAVLGGFLLSRYFVNRFLKPIRLLTEGISKVRAGELDLSIDITANDESGRLAEEFNEMTKRLRIYEQSTMGTLMGEKNKSMAIVKSIPDPLIVLDNDYRILLINKACESFFGIREADVLDRHLLEHIHNGQLFDLLSKSTGQGKENTDTILYFDQGEGFYFNVVVTPMTDRDKNTTGYIMLMQDVTKLKELERVKTDFVATISHEFKTPLTSIVMGASILDEEGLGKLKPEQKEIVKTVLEDGEKLSRFVGELLELSRIESGKALYSLAACSFNAIAENSCRGFYETAKRNGITIVSELDENLPLIYADFEKVTWVLNNLLSNALKYTAEGDTITINAKPEGDFLVSSVKDTGEGIPAEYIDRIFEKYVQVKGRDIEVRGTGLGLSVAKEIIEANGGGIGVRSVVGEGSIFTFTLPLDTAQREGGR
jgi:PAS domain S-box-containing protein